MMAIVERGCVYEITKLLYITLTRAHFSFDRGLQLLPYQSTTRKLIRNRNCLAIK